MPLAAVIIPIYKNTLSTFEKVSLEQCVKVLGKHPLIVIKPISLDIKNIEKQYPQLSVETFDDGYFKSVHTYNRLMLAPEFYQRFLDYKYMLIYQLDAFVFKDELVYWCNEGYDYIGAPWRIEREFSSGWDYAYFLLKKKLAIWLQLSSKNEMNEVIPYDVVLKFSVGNGGFSLRKTQKLLDIVLAHQSKIEEYLSHSSNFYNEDMFFCIEMNRYYPRLRIPDWRTALRFSAEHLPQKSVKLNGGLPFGCHAWYIYETEFWKKEIAKFGYELSEKTI